MIDVYHCPKCSRLLKCEGVVTIAGYELPVFSCEDCIVRKAVFGPGTEEFDLAYTFCVDAAGRCFDPADHLFESDEDEEENADDDSAPRCQPELALVLRVVGRTMSFEERRSGAGEGIRGRQCPFRFCARSRRWP